MRRIKRPKIRMNFWRMITPRNPKKIMMLFLGIIVLVIMIILGDQTLKSYKENQASKTRQYVIVKEQMDVRTGPGMSYPSLAKVVDKDKQYRIIDKTDTWFYVEVDDSINGWIAGWKTNANVKSPEEILDEQIKQYIIVLDPGHGGKDSGAIGNRNNQEKDITLLVANLIKNKFEQEGFTVRLTRTDDYYVSLDDRNTPELESGASAYISIHFDSSPNKVGTVSGFTTYYSKDDDSQVLAQYVSNAIGARMPLFNRGVKQEPLQVTAFSKIPAILLEGGYMNNPTDEYMLSNPIYQDIYAESIKEGIKGYLYTLPGRQIKTEPVLKKEQESTMTTEDTLSH